MREPEDRWDVRDPPAIDVLTGPVTELLEPADIPRELPQSRPAGFTARL